MTLSRTARILIALLLLAAAAFVWINFFASTPDTPSPVAGPTVTAPADPADGAAADGAAADGVAADGVAADGGTRPAPTVATDAPNGTTGAGTEAPTVVAGPDTDVVGRDVVVAELPFLVTAPPAVRAEDGAEDGDADAAGRQRPGAGARASVNPFSPIVTQQPATAAAPQAAPASGPGTSPEVVEVDVPDGPPVQTVEASVPTPDAPAPRALTPSSPRASALPRALPSGMLPVAPALLTSTRAEAAPRTPANLPAMAAVREPDAPADVPAFAPIGGAPLATGAEPQPLGPGEVPTAGIPDSPLVSGADALSRYLRDNDVAFTGSVVGSVGVGVFRSTASGAPLVLALGQPIPDTEIVLTDLRGQAAEFTLGDTTHVLNLDLRR